MSQVDRKVKGMVTYNVYLLALYHNHFITEKARRQQKGDGGERT